MFGDIVTANMILKCEDPLEAKRHRISGVDHVKWHLDGYEVRCQRKVPPEFYVNVDVESDHTKAPS